MIRLVPGKFPVRIPGERYAKIHQIGKGPDTGHRFHQSNIPVSGTAAEGTGQIHRRIGIFAAEPQFVIGLLVTAGIDGGPHGQPFGDDGYIFHPFGTEA